MALPPLNVVIGANTDALDTALGRARRGLGALAAAAGAAGLAVAAGLTTMTRSGLAAVDAQQKLARSIDGTVNGLRAVQLAAGYAGVSVGEANTSLQQMNRELARADAEAGPAREALQRLGLTAADFAELDTDERAALMADRIHQLGLSSGQASDILRDLGVRSRNMALLMTQGGDAIRSARQEVRDFGLELSENQTAAVEAANDAVSRMGLVFEGLRSRLAVEVAPALQAVADQFNQLARSENVQRAIERLAQAFGGLAEIVLSEDFISVAISGLEGLANIAATVADGMVGLSQNLELVTAAMSGLAIAAAALGGPLWLVAGALSAALVGLSTLRTRAEGAGRATGTAAEAQERLNEAIGSFNASDGAPEANRLSRQRAADLEQQALAALAAAEAELARAQAEQESRLNDAPEWIRDAVAGGAMIPEVEAASERVAALREQLNAVRQTLDGLSRGGIMDLGEVIVGPDDEGDTPSIPGLGSGDDVRQQLADRLGALQQGLMTEQETIAAWYEASRETLAEALEAELLTEAEYKEARERLEEEHQERLAAIRDMGNQNALSSIVGTGREILGAIGQHNRKAMQAAKALGQFEALVNAYRAASQVLADPTVPWFQKIAAAGSVLAAGIGFANAIKGMSDGGGGGGGARGGGGGGSSGGGGSRPLDVMLNLQGPNAAMFGPVIGDLFDALRKEAGDRGVNMVGVRY